MKKLPWLSIVSGSACAAVGEAECERDGDDFAGSWAILAPTLEPRKTSSEFRGTMKPPLLPRLLAPRLPFYYGWVVLGCLCLAGFARQGPAVAVLSVFVVPMTEAFGWSRASIAGAVSLGGLLAAFVSPMLGPMLDRRGPRLILCLAVLSTGLSTMALSLTQSLVVFYLLFCSRAWSGRGRSISASTPR